MQAMLAGQVPVGLVGATHVVNANTGGGDFVMILGLQNSLIICSSPGRISRAAEELKGKKVAIGTPAGSASLATYVALDYLGLSPRRDNIVLLGIGGVPESVRRSCAPAAVEATSLSPGIRPTWWSVKAIASCSNTAKENVAVSILRHGVARSMLKANPQLVETIVQGDDRGRGLCP